MKLVGYFGGRNASSPLSEWIKRLQVLHTVHQPEKLPPIDQGKRQRIFSDSILLVITPHFFDSRFGRIAVNDRFT
jgi:hypothetical protein